LASIANPQNPIVTLVAQFQGVGAASPKAQNSIKNAYFFADSISLYKSVECDIVASWEIHGIAHAHPPKTVIAAASPDPGE
jgi:hypothetical protein